MRSNGQNTKITLMRVFWRQKLSSQTRTVLKTDAENRRQKMESIYAGGFWCVCHGY